MLESPAFVKAVVTVLNTSWSAWRSVNMAEAAGFLANVLNPKPHGVSHTTFQRQEGQESPIVPYRTLQRMTSHP